MRSGVVLAAGVVLCLSGCGRPMAVRPAPKPAVATRAARPSSTASKSKGKTRTSTLARRATRPAAKPVRVDSLKLETALLQEHSSAPLAWVLARRSGNPEIAHRAAAAVLYEARRLDLSPSLLAAVLMVENTPMDPTAESGAGAIGLMQVMPMHIGGWGCPSHLEGVEVNICHGARLLHQNMRRSPTTQMALRRYNGCMGSLVTRSCLRYPARVLRTASRIRAEMLKAPIEAIKADEPAVEPPPYFLRRASVEPEPEPVIPEWTALALYSFPEPATLATRHSELGTRNYFMRPAGSPAFPSGS